MHKYPAAPHPFVILPPLEAKREYVPGEYFHFGLTLVGSCSSCSILGPNMSSAPMRMMMCQIAHLAQISPEFRHCLLRFGKVCVRLSLIQQPDHQIEAVFRLPALAMIAPHTGFGTLPDDPTDHPLLHQAKSRRQVIDRIHRAGSLTSLSTDTPTRTIGRGQI